MTIEERRAYDREWKRKERLKNPGKARAYGRLKYQRLKKDPKKVETRKEYMRVYHKEWMEKNRNNPQRLLRRREWARAWNMKNAKRLYKQRRARPYERLASVVRARIYDVLKHGYKSDRTANLIGISIKELKPYLESQFKEGMTWENYGFYGWHIDHRVPLSSFDLSNAEEQKKAFHYTNLQPLWAKENLQKHSKML